MVQLRTGMVDSQLVQIEGKAQEGQRLKPQDRIESKGYDFMNKRQNVNSNAQGRLTGILDAGYRFKLKSIQSNPILIAIYSYNMQIAQKFLTRIDNFKVPVTLLYQSSEFSTIQGGIVTIILFALAVAFLQPSIWNFFSFGSYSYTSDLTYNFPETNLTINNDIAISVWNLNLGNKRAFNVFFTVETYKFGPNGQFISLIQDKHKGVMCDYSLWKNRYGQIAYKAFSLWGTKNICAPPSLNVTIFGRYTTNSSRLIVTVQRCYQSDCVTDSQLNSYPIPYLIAVLFPELRFSFNSSSPIYYTLKDDIWFQVNPTNKAMTRGYQISLKDITVDDSNTDIWPQSVTFLHNNTNLYTGYVYDTVFDNNRIIGLAKAMFTFTKSPKHELFKRKLIKVDQLLAYIGGFLSTLMIIGQIIIKGFNQIKLKTLISQKVKSNDYVLTSKDYFLSFIPFCKNQRLENIIAEIEASISIQSILAVKGEDRIQVQRQRHHELLEYQSQVAPLQTILMERRNHQQSQDVVPLQEMNFKSLSLGT